MPIAEEDIAAAFKLFRDDASGKRPCHILVRRVVGSNHVAVDPPPLDAACNFVKNNDVLGWSCRWQKVRPK
jgi:hypothetical protein